MIMRGRYGVEPPNEGPVIFVASFFDGAMTDFFAGRLRDARHGPDRSRVLVLGPYVQFRVCENRLIVPGGAYAPGETTAVNLCPTDRTTTHYTEHAEEARRAARHVLGEATPELRTYLALARKIRLGRRALANRI